MWNLCRLVPSLCGPTAGGEGDGTLVADRRGGLDTQCFMHKLDGLDGDAVGHLPSQRAPARGSQVLPGRYAGGPTLGPVAADGTQNRGDTPIVQGD